MTVYLFNCDRNNNRIFLANSPNQTWFGFELLRLLLRDFERPRSGLQVSKTLTL